MQAPFFTSKESKLFSSLPLHFVLSNRHHGISNPPYQSLNLAYHVQDSESNVSHNRAHIMQTYYPNKTLLYYNQIHSNIIFTMQKDRKLESCHSEFERSKNEESFNLCKREVLPHSIRQIHESHLRPEPRTPPKQVKIHESVMLSEAKHLSFKNNKMSPLYSTIDSSLSTKVQNDKMSESIFRTPSPALTQNMVQIHKSNLPPQSHTPPKQVEFHESMNPKSINLATPHIYNEGRSIPQQSSPITADSHEVLVGNGDGIICSQAQFVAMSMVADCNPILVYAPSRNVFALLHAGRAGVCGKILTHALLLLTHDYNAPKSDVRIFIGASIRKCCYEIGRDLATQIAKAHGAQYLYEGDGRITLDMIGMLLDEAESFGIARNQIEIHESCSCCDGDYFSYRREGETGRFGLFASLCS